MPPSKVFSAIRRDATHLARRYATEHLCLWAVVGALSLLRQRFPAGPFALAPWHLLAAALAIPFGWWVASVVHNAGHNNFGGPLRNRVMGELSGAYLGYGFTSFILIHGLHHMHADREDDPVSPEGMSFLRYFSGPLRYPTARARRTLFRLHGHTPGHGFVRALEVLFFGGNLLLRVAAWYLLFGPSLFVAFYVTSIVSDVAILAHINFACHRNREDGAVEIVNLTDSLYYRVANAVTTGGYFHKNHHLRPELFDPRSFESDPAPLLSLPPDPARATTARQHAGRGLRRYFDLVGLWG